MPDLSIYQWKIVVLLLIIIQMMIIPLLLNNFPEGYHIPLEITSTYHIAFKY